MLEKQAVHVEESTTLQLFKCKNIPYHHFTHLHRTEGRNKWEGYWQNKLAVIGELGHSTPSSRTQESKLLKAE